MFDDTYDVVFGYGAPVAGVEGAGAVVAVNPVVVHFKAVAFNGAVVEVEEAAALFEVYAFKYADDAVVEGVGVGCEGNGVAFSGQVEGAEVVGIPAMVVAGGKYVGVGDAGGEGLEGVVGLFGAYLEVSVEVELTADNLEGVAGEGGNAFDHAGTLVHFEGLEFAPVFAGEEGVETGVLAAEEVVAFAGFVGYYGVGFGKVEDDDVVVLQRVGLEEAVVAVGVVDEVAGTGNEFVDEDEFSAVYGRFHGGGGHLQQFNAVAVYEVGEEEAESDPQ